MYCGRKYGLFFVREFAFECNRRAFIELQMLQCFIFKLTDSRQTVTMLQYSTTRARTVRSSQTRVVPLYSHALVSATGVCVVSVSVGTGGSGHAGNVADLRRAARSEALFSLQTHPKHTRTRYITLLRIWPDVETFRMSFCGDPCSCSGSLSDDSTSAAAAPTAAILRSNPRDSHSVPAGPASQRRRSDRPSTAAGSAAYRTEEL